METNEETPADRLLIWENVPEQQRILSEIENRRFILNKLAKAGLSKDEIVSITSSLESIEKYIFKKQLDENQTLKALADSGIKGLTAELSPGLNQLGFDLKAWQNVRPVNRNADKFENLVYADSWQLDQQAIENSFIKSQLKYFVEGEALREYKKLQAQVEYMEEERYANNQVASVSCLSQRFEPIGMHKFRVRWTYIRDKYQRS